jgi:hypothetical protein
LQDKERTWYCECVSHALGARNLTSLVSFQVCTVRDLSKLLDADLIDRLLVLLNLAYDHLYVNISGLYWKVLIQPDNIVCRYSRLQRKPSFMKRHEVPDPYIWLSKRPELHMRGDWSLGFVTRYVPSRLYG